jgi:hypothetical protein
VTAPLAPAPEEPARKVHQRIDEDVVDALHAVRVRWDRAFRREHGRKMTISDVIRRLIEEKV